MNQKLIEKLEELNESAIELATDSLEKYKKLKDNAPIPSELEKIGNAISILVLNAQRIKYFKENK